MTRLLISECGMRALDLGILTDVEVIISSTSIELAQN